ncbi:PfkB family carbohydrate kinase [Arthrobacter sedimenti]|uniref:PfkB family carbohydrate kinase n=1 Tax=Arthrobacter sedimenti TaxID=2694931 RepID=UPI00141E7DCD|nr:PfkB family carbohydrate kinase [Arthrobacter sedimenti]
MKVIGFGDNIMDSFIDRGISYPGGNCLNFAVMTRKLGAEASYLGVFGSDPMGTYLQDVLTLQGVTFPHAQIRRGSSGAAHILVVNGERVILESSHGGVTADQPFILSEQDIDYLNGFDLVHSSAYSSSEEELPKLRRLECLTSFDFSDDAEYRTREYLERVAPSVDLALFSCSETGLEATKELLRRTVALGPAMAVATRGPEPAIVFDGRDFHTCPAGPVVKQGLLVDTMGCGDAFIAAFTLRLLESGWTRSTLPAGSVLATALVDGRDNAASQCLVEASFACGLPMKDHRFQEGEDGQREGAPSFPR